MARLAIVSYIRYNPVSACRIIAVNRKETLAVMVNDGRRNQDLRPYADLLGWTAI